MGKRFVLFMLPKVLVTKRPPFHLIQVVLALQIIFACFTCAHKGDRRRTNRAGIFLVRLLKPLDLQTSLADRPRVRLAEQGLFCDRLVPYRSRSSPFSHRGYVGIPLASLRTPYLCTTDSLLLLESRSPRSRHTSISFLKHD